MRAFAQNTKVPVERSQAEIERMLKGRGGQKFSRGDDGKFEAVCCQLNERLLMFELPLPTEEEARSQEKRDRIRRAKWRALLLTVKAKFVSVDSGVEAFDEAFLAQIVVPGDDGRAARVGRIAQLQIAAAYKKGTIPNFGAAGLLEAGGAKP
jgi:hypothetical protein